LPRVGAGGGAVGLARGRGRVGRRAGGGAWAGVTAPPARSLLCRWVAAQGPMSPIVRRWLAVLGSTLPGTTVRLRVGGREAARSPGAPAAEILRVSAQAWWRRWAEIGRPVGGRVGRRANELGGAGPRRTAPRARRRGAGEGARRGGGARALAGDDGASVYGNLRGVVASADLRCARRESVGPQPARAGGTAVRIGRTSCRSM
jgi:hypothetical protein